MAQLCGFFLDGRNDRRQKHGRPRGSRRIVRPHDQRRRRLAAHPLKHGQQRGKFPTLIDERPHGRSLARFKHRKPLLDDVEIALARLGRRRSLNQLLAQIALFVGKLGRGVGQALDTAPVVPQLLFDRIELLERIGGLGLLRYRERPGAQKRPDRRSAHSVPQFRPTRH
ncbi:MAG: hypothetical protein SGI91_15700 [Alphaproteobacteria bacterium]|nr:hypothetical protein [Alphaproteobacteria bacterium]